jgi:amino acid transporter
MRWTWESGHDHDVMAPLRGRTALVPDRLGALGLVFFVLGAAAPLASTAGGTSTGWAVTGVAGIPIAFLVTAVLLMVFLGGYAAMSRHVINAGAIYTFVSLGLGRAPGVGAAFVALLAYAAMQIGLFGGIGAVAAGFLDPRLGVELPWWCYATLAWLLIFFCGRRRVEVNSRVLGILMAAECLLLLLFDAIMLAHPHGGRVSLATLSLSNLTSASIVVAIVICVTSYVGVEDAANYAEEARRGTVGQAMVGSVVVAAILYAVSAWAMSVAAGPAEVVPAARAEGFELIFTLAGGVAGPGLVDAGHALLLTSLFASALAFHNTLARYLFALGRDGVLPAILGTTSPRTGAPANASVIHSVLALAVITTAAIWRWDPMISMFFWMGTLAGLGVVALMALASAAVVGFFWRDHRGERLAYRVLLPALSTGGLGAVFILTLTQYATLLGLPPGSPLAWQLPSLIAVVFALGLLRAGYLTARRMLISVGAARYGRRRRLG